MLSTLLTLWLSNFVKQWQQNSPKLPAPPPGFGFCERGDTQVKRMSGAPRKESGGGAAAPWKVMKLKISKISKQFENESWYNKWQDSTPWQMNSHKKFWKFTKKTKKLGENFKLIVKIFNSLHELINIKDCVLRNEMRLSS